MMRRSFVSLLSRRVIIAMSGNRTVSFSDVAGLKQSGQGGSVRVDVDADHVAVITMDRGENSVNDQFLEQMNTAIDQVLCDESVNAVILTGCGKFFSNGGDMNWYREVQRIAPHHAEALARNFVSVAERVLTLPMPTVAAINGHAFGSGAYLSTCCDYRVMAADRGWLCFNEIHVGLRIGPGLPIVCRIKFGGNSMRWIPDALVFGRRYTADEAKSVGMVTESCPSTDELMPTARALLVTVLSSSGGVAFDRDLVSHVKKQIYREALRTPDASPVHQ